MIKKIFTFGLLLSLVAFCSTSNAQEQEYPHYGFWSNWSLGGSFGVVKQGGRNWHNGRGMNIGATLIAEKELNYVWDYRMALQVPGVYNGNVDVPFDRYVSFVMGVKFSINDAIKGYDPDRRGSLYLLAMAGLSADRSDITNRINQTSKHKSPFALVGEVGLGYSHKVCKHSTIFVEAIADDHGGFRNMFQEKNRPLFYWDAMLHFGWLYNFGPTQADLDRLANMGQINGGNCEALNNEISELKNKVDNKDKQIKKLENRVSQLEKELANVKPGNNAAADSLQRLIDNVKAEQMTYYALPFSILFDVDQYTVKDSEMKKLEAVARVMKDNTNTKFNLYGFCDNSGSDSYNQKLSEKRVAEVKRLLVKKYGIAENRLTTEGKGKSVNFGDASYSINRRVSFYRVIE